MGSDPAKGGEADWYPDDTVSATAHFDGELAGISGARLVAERFLATLAVRAAPSSPGSHDDILLVVTELAANAVQYAPGPFTLRLRHTFEGVQVTVRDTSPVTPEPCPAEGTGRHGGLGWCLIAALAEEVSILPDPGGKDIHAFMPW